MKSSSKAKAAAARVEHGQELTTTTTTFAQCYSDLCLKSDLAPVKSVTALASDAILDINGDKMAAEDWKPLAESLEHKNNLKFIAIRSYWKADKSNPRPAPAIQQTAVAGRLVSSVAVALRHTTDLRCLELQRLPLDSKSIHILSEGLGCNHTLQHLSLQQCSIGDDGVQVLRKTLKTCFNITSINLIECGLSWKAMHSLASLLKHQSLLRETFVWQESLRDAIGNGEPMGGLQRISLNDNPLIADKGAFVLADVLKEDVFIKAVDIQNCGIQDSGAKVLLSSLKCNSTLYILDLRRNFVVDADVLMRISQQLSFNVQDQSSQYKWLSIATSKTEKNVGGKTWKKRGIPWRLNYRLSHSRSLPSQQTPGIANMFLQSRRPSLSGSEVTLASVKTSSGRVRRTSAKVGNCKMLATIEIEFKQLQDLLLTERSARLRAEKKIEELMSENEDLKNKLVANESSSKLDEQTLATIEDTFANFNDFIKILQNVE